MSHEVTQQKVDLIFEQHRVELHESRDFETTRDGAPAPARSEAPGAAMPDHMLCAKQFKTLAQ